MTIGDRSTDEPAGKSALTPTVAALCSIGAIAAVALVERTALATLVTLPLLVLPGYAILVSLRPIVMADGGARRDQSRAGSTGARLRFLATAIGTSLVVLSVVGLALAPLPVGAFPFPLVLAVGVVTAALAGATALRRVRRRQALSLWRPFGALPGDLDRGSIALVALTGVLIVGVGAIGLAPEAEGFTEFYLLEPAGGEPTVPDNATVEANASGRFLVGVENHERRSVNYTVIAQQQIVEVTDDETTVVDRRELDRFAVRLDHEESREIRHSFTLEDAADRTRLVYLLYRDRPPSTPSRENAYQSLVVWDDPS